MEFKNILKRAILNTIEKWDSESSKEMLVFSVGNTIDMFFDMQETTTTTTSKKRERSPSPSISSSSSIEEEEEEPDFDLFDDDEDDPDDPDNGGNYYYYDHDEEALHLLINAIRENGYNEVQSSDWFNRRYGRVLKGIRANHRADAQAHIDNMSNGNNHEVIVERHPGKTKCCFCNMSKACNQTLKTPTGNFPIARCCGKLASALIEFYRILKQLVDENNDGSGFITLDRAFKAVMDASEKR